MHRRAFSLSLAASLVLCLLTLLRGLTPLARAAESDAAAATETEAVPRFRTVTPEQILALANDDDWLTGIWNNCADSAMSMYTLFEREGEGYRVSYYYRRYTITWWTMRVEKTDNEVRLWDMELGDEHLEMPREPNVIYRRVDENDHLVSDTGHDMREMYPILTPERLPDYLNNIERAKFTNDGSWMKHQYARRKALRESTPYCGLLSDHFEHHEQWGEAITGLAVVAQETVGDETYLLLNLSVSRPPQSGAGGASGRLGYWWLHLHGHGDQTTVKDDWLLLASDYIDLEVRREQTVDKRYRLTLQDWAKEIVYRTYEMPVAGIARPPVLLPPPPGEEPPEPPGGGPYP